MILSLENRKKQAVFLIIVSVCVISIAWDAMSTEPFSTSKRFIRFIKTEVIDVDERRAKEWESFTRPLAKVNRNTKTILLYTTYFETMPWSNLDLPATGGNTSCDPEICVVSYSRKDLKRSDAVVFHGSTRYTPSQRTLKTALKQKTKHQRWVFYTHENPINTRLESKYLNGMINWTMTYRSDSDIFLPYSFYRTFTNSETLPAARNYAQGKTKLIAWFVSHCGRIRDDIVQHLIRYVPISIFGKCQKFFHQKRVCARGSAACDTIIRKHKFYLAFENENCYDYITEKYWSNALKKEVVPIVMGGAGYNPTNSIPGSYINILDFPNVKALARYLRYLDANDTAYNEYFNWKLKYTITPEPYWLCALCQKLHRKEEPSRTWNNFGNYWSAEKTCYINNSYITNEWLNS